MIHVKDMSKMIGISIVSFCAVFVCALFLNFYLDLIPAKALIHTDAAKILYEAQCSTAKVVSIVSGGCLLFTTAVLLCFDIGHYIDARSRQLGVLKALGWPGFSVALHFWAFGPPVLAGTALGYAGAHLFMPVFYETQNKDGFLPDISIAFHPGLCLCLVFVPAAFFSLLAIACSYIKLKVPALRLIREQSLQKAVPAKRETDLPFLQELKKSNVRQRKSLVFFLTFSVFCFASTTQMSGSMTELSSPLMAYMILSIGVLLAAVTLLIATTSVIRANRKTIAMMKAFGYRAGECSRAVLDGYRPWTYLGFALGTVYQYVLLKLTVTVVFRDFEDIPAYEFDVPAMFLSLAAFLILYETVLWGYTKQMKKISLKEIMLD